MVLPKLWKQRPQHIKCGYIGSNFWNKGRTQEIKERVLHIDNKDYVEEDECKCGCEKHEHSEEKEAVTSK